MSQPNRKDEPLGGWEDPRYRARYAGLSVDQLAAEADQWDDNRTNPTYFCPACLNEIDPGICCCGSPLSDHGGYFLSHSFVPHGCTCGYTKKG